MIVRIPCTLIVEVDLDVMSAQISAEIAKETAATLRGHCLSSVNQERASAFQTRLETARRRILEKLQEGSANYREIETALTEPGFKNALHKAFVDLRSKGVIVADHRGRYQVHPEAERLLKS